MNDQGRRSAPDRHVLILGKLAQTKSFTDPASAYRETRKCSWEAASMKCFICQLDWRRDIERRYPMRTAPEASSQGFRLLKNGSSPRIHFRKLDTTIRQSRAGLVSVESDGQTRPSLCIKEATVSARTEDIQGCRARTMSPMKTSRERDSKSSTSAETRLETRKHMYPIDRSHLRSPVHDTSFSVY